MYAIRSYYGIFAAVSESRGFLLLSVYLGFFDLFEKFELPKQQIIPFAGHRFVMCQIISGIP